MSQNKGFIMDILISVLVSISLMFVWPESFLGKLFQLTKISNGFRVFIVLWSALNYYCLMYIPNKTKGYFKKRRSNKKYKNILKEQNISFVV